MQDCYRSLKMLCGRLSLKSALALCKSRMHSAAGLGLIAKTYLNLPLSLREGCEEFVRNCDFLGC